jgi:hypothetical protein
LNVKGLSLKGKADQAYWTVGSTFDYDIVLPKLTQTLGSQFAILKRGGDYFIKDISKHGIDSHTLVRLLKSEGGVSKYPLNERDILVLTSCHYHVDTAGEHYKLTLVKETNPSEDPKKAAPQTMESDTGASITIGRLKKNKLSCPHGDVSSSHATVYPGFVEDQSTNGTLVNYHNRATFVKVPAGSGVKIGDVEILFK